MGPVSGQRSFFDRLEERLTRFWSVTPGIRRGGDGRIVAYAVAYGLVFLPFFALLFLVLPAVGFFALLWFALLTGGWNAREAITARLPQSWRPAPGSHLQAWFGVLVLLLIVGFPAALLASLAYTFAPLTALAWWIVWRENRGVAFRVVQAVVAIVFMPLALGLWYVRGRGGWSKVASLTGILLSMETYVFLLVLWLGDHTVFGDGALAALLLLSVSFVFLGGAFLISVAIRIADGFCEAQPLGARSTAGRSKVARPSIISVGVLLPLRLGLWGLVQAAFVAPWVYEIENLPQIANTRFLIYGLVATAALPMAVTSLVAVLVGWHGHRQTAGQAMEQHLGVALSSSLLLALGVSVTFAALTDSVFWSTWDPNVPWVLAFWAFTSVTGAVAGLNIGLSLRLVKRGAARKRWTYLSSGATTILVALAVVVFLGAAAFATASDGPFRSPNEARGLGIDFAFAALFPALAVASLSSGLLISAILYPALQSFARTMSGLREMAKPIVGFVCGYALIVLTFGAIYYGVYLKSPASFICTQIEGSSASCAPQAWGERDFMFLSANTSLPLGFSPIKPVENHVQWLSMAELWVATAWVVVVFAAMLHTIQTQMVKKISAEQLARMRQKLGPQVWPGETGMTSYDWPD